MVYQQQCRLQEGGCETKNDDIVLLLWARELAEGDHSKGDGREEDCREESRRINFHNNMNIGESNNISS